MSTRVLPSKRSECSQPPPVAIPRGPPVTLHHQPHLEQEALRQAAGARAAPWGGHGCAAGRVEGVGHSVPQGLAGPDTA